MVAVSSHCTEQNRTGAPGKGSLHPQMLLFCWSAISLGSASWGLVFIWPDSAHFVQTVLPTEHLLKTIGGLIIAAWDYAAL